MGTDDLMSYIISEFANAHSDNEQRVKIFSSFRCDWSASLYHF